MIMTKKKNDDDIVKEVVKKKPRGKNIEETRTPDTMPGDNQKYLLVSLEISNLPDIDIHNPEQVKQRINEYFQIHADNDMKPTVAGLGIALGMDRRRLWEIKTDVPDRNNSLPTLTRDLIKKAYKMLENLWENYMQNGKYNPVTGIFLGKNNFGYQDKTEYVLTPNTNSDSPVDKEDIMSRYVNDSSNSPTLPTIDSADSADS
jgi:hypothetical protein